MSIVDPKSGRMIMPPLSEKLQRTFADYCKDPMPIAANTCLMCASNSIKKQIDAQKERKNNGTSN